MHASAIDLVKNVNAAVDSTPISWRGGRTAIALVASAYGTTVKLQLQSPDGTTWIDINGTTYSANQVTAYDLPAGLYRMHITGGTTTALYAKLVSIPYG